MGLPLLKVWIGFALFRVSGSVYSFQGLGLLSLGFRSGRTACNTSLWFYSFGDSLWV